MKVGNKHINVIGFAGMSKDEAMKIDSAIGDVWDEVQAQLKLANLETEPKAKKVKKKSEEENEEAGE